MELVNYILNQLKKLGADDVVVNFSKVDGSQIKFVNNKIVKTESETLENVGVFVTKDKKIGSTTIKDFKSTKDEISFSKTEIDKNLKKLMKFIKNLQVKEDFFGIAKGPFKYKEIDGLYDGKIANLEEKQIDVVETAINKAIENGAKRCGGILETSCGSNFLVTSEKVEAQERGTSIYLSIRANVDKESSGHMTASSRSLSKFKAEEAASFAGQIAKLSMNPHPINPGRYNVVMAPLLAGNILENVAGSTSIFSVEANLSFFADKLKKKVANENVNLYDDATLPSGLNSTKYDAEGSPTKKNIIIDKGFLKTYLHNYSTAKKNNVENTCNAGLISPNPSNIILEKGNFSKEELFKEMKNGLYLTNTWYTRFNNYSTGDFSTIPRDGAFLVENGEIKHSVRQIRISDNMLNILKNIVALGNKQFTIHSWEVDNPVVCPFILVNNVNITKPLS